MPDFFWTWDAGMAPSPSPPPLEGRLAPCPTALQPPQSPGSGAGGQLPPPPLGDAQASRLAPHGSLAGRPGLAPPPPGPRTGLDPPGLPGTGGSWPTRGWVFGTRAQVGSCCASNVFARGVKGLLLFFKKNCFFPSLAEYK